MLPELSKILNLLERDFSALRVLVVGDVMLDRYITGEVERISPEAPVPVLRQSGRYDRPGGAANVAMNLAGLGVKTMLCGAVAEDEAGRALRAAMQIAGISTTSLVTCALPTITKTRVVSRTQQLLRLDVESRDDFARHENLAMTDAALRTLPDVHAVILSDYAKGTLTEELCRTVIDAARERKIPVFVDPKARDLSRYAGATTICPNVSELSVATGVPVHDIDGLLLAAHGLLASLRIDFLTVTMSERGIRVLRPDGDVLHSAAKAREVFDVSGAGDTVIATLAAALAGGLQLGSAVELANFAAGIVVAKIGTVPVMAADIVAQLTRSATVTSKEKVVARDRAIARVKEWRDAGETIVFTNGCFDLLHVGHITLLEDCLRFGSKLVVALNTDASVRRLKGPTRPIVGEAERAKVMAALAAVDLVTLFDEPTPLELICALKPAVLVKGGDYRVETVVGHGEVQAYGGRVEIVPIVEGFSTTNLVRKMMRDERA